MTRIQIILVLFSCCANAQNRFSIVGNSCASIPVGSFEKINPEVMRYFAYGRQQYAGFLKKGFGAAKPGFNFGLGVSYRLSNKIETQLNFSRSRYKVEVRPYEQFLKSEYGGFEYTFDHDPYTISMVNASLYYKIISLSKVSLALSGGCGAARLDFPDYSMYTQLISVTLTTKNYAESTNSNAFTFRLGFKARYVIKKRISSAIVLQYMRANFAYGMDLMTSPGGSGNLIIRDEVNYRVFNAGLSVSYGF